MTTLIPIDPPLPADAEPLSDGHVCGAYFEYADDDGIRRTHYRHKPIEIDSRRVVACRPVRVEGKWWWEVETEERS